MRLACKTEFGDGVIVGYCPDKDGMPQAIVAFEDGRLINIRLRFITLLNVPVVDRVVRNKKKPNRQVPQKVSDSDSNVEKNVSYGVVC